MVAPGFSLTKACDACIKAKRKCDMTLPECSRCSKKRLKCSYKNEPLSGPLVTGKQGGRVHQTNHSQAPKNLKDHAWSNWRHESGCRGCSKHSSSDSSSLGSPEAYRGKWPSSPSALTIMQPTCLEMRLKVDDGTLEYLLTQLRRFPETLVKSGSTPFIHPHLYRNSLPKSMRQAYAACSMDAQKGHQNHPVSPQALDSIISDILAGATSVVCFMDSLAFVQALVLVQILTLFSPSISLKQRMEADKRQALLDHWAHKLWRQAPRELPSSLSPYESYIVAESTRRTLYIWNKVRCTYDSFSKGYFVHTMFAEAMPLDRRTALWDIPDEELWNNCKTSTEPEIVSYREFTDLWDTGHIRQGGWFETILLIACRGKTCVDAKIKAQQFIEL